MYVWMDGWMERTWTYFVDDRKIPVFNYIY